MAEWSYSPLTGLPKRRAGCYHNLPFFFFLNAKRKIKSGFFCPSLPPVTLLLQEEVAQQSSFPGELWVLFVEGSQAGLLLSGTLCHHSALHQPCFTSKHLSAYGCFCHIPKQPRPSSGLGALLKEPVPLHCLAGLGALPCSPCKCFQEEEEAQTQPCAAWEPPASVCPGAENPDCEEVSIMCLI